MGKKQIVLMALAVLLVPSVCMALPKVQLKSDCSFATTIDGQGALLLNNLSMFIDGLPSYDVADLENGAAGDGVPDSFQLGLLAAAMCEGEMNLQAQFNLNKGLVANQLLAPLGQAGGLLFGVTGYPGIYAQAVALSAALKSWAATPGLPAELSTAALGFAAQLDGLLLEIDTFLTDSSLTVSQLSSYLNVALTVLNQVTDLLAGLVGLDTEMIGILYNYLTPDIQADIDGYIADIRTQYVPMITGFLAQAGDLMPQDLKDKMNMAAADLTSAANLVESFKAFVMDPGFAIYGVSGKTASEPFSGAGDYNGDGVNNATVFSELNASGWGSRANFVMAASGFTPLWFGRDAGLPVAGMVGMALLAGVVALGGALSIRKK